MRGLKSWALTLRSAELEMQGKGTGQLPSQTYGSPWASFSDFQLCSPEPQVLRVSLLCTVHNAGHWGTVTSKQDAVLPYEVDGLRQVM